MILSFVKSADKFAKRVCARVYGGMIGWSEGGEIGNGDKTKQTIEFCT